MESSKLKKLKAENGRLKQENAKLRRNLEELEKIDSTKTNNVIKEERSKARLLNNKLQSLSAQLNHKNEEMRRLQNRLLGKTGEVSSFTESKSEENTHVGKKDSQKKSSYKARDASIETLQNKNKRLTRELENFRLDNQNLLQELAHAYNQDKEKAFLENEIKSLAADLLDARKDLENVTLRIKKKVSEYFSLKEEIDIKRQELDRLVRAISIQTKTLEDCIKREHQGNVHIAKLTSGWIQIEQEDTLQLKNTEPVAQESLRPKEAGLEMIQTCEREIKEHNHLEPGSEKRKQVVDDVDGQSKRLRQKTENLARKLHTQSENSDNLQKIFKDENEAKTLRESVTSLQMLEKKLRTHCQILCDENKRQEEEILKNKEELNQIKEEQSSSIWRIKDLETQLRELKSKHSRCLKFKSSFQSKEKEYKIEIQKLHEQVNHLNERADSFKCQLTHALEQVTEKSKMLQEREIRLAAFDKKKERYYNDVTHLKSALEESQRLKEAKDQQLTCLGQMAKELKMKIQELEYSQESKIKHEKEIHLTDLEMFQCETHKRLSEANEKLVQERLLHEKEADESKHSIETMKNINEDLQNKNQYLSITQNTIKYLEEQNRQLQSKENEYSLLISSSESTEVKLKEKIHQQEKQLNSDKEKMSNLQHQLEQALGELSECKDKIKERDVRLLECQQKQAKESEVLRQDTNERVKTLQEDNIVKESKLISERNQHVKSIDTLQEKLSEADEKLNQQYYEHVKKTEKLEARIKSLQSSEAKLQSLNKILHDGNKEQENKLRSENTELRENLARLTDNVKYFETYIKDLQSRRSESEMLIKSFQSKEAEFSFKLQDLKDQLIEERNNASRFEDQADQALKETNEYKKKLWDVETRLCTINEENLRYENENARLKSELDQCQRANATTEKQNLILQEKKKALQVKIKEHKQSIQSEQSQEQSNHARELELLQAEMTKKLTKVNKELNEERLQHSKVVKELENCIKTDQHTNEKLKNETQRLNQLQNERDQIQQKLFSYKNKFKDLESHMQQLQSKEEECKLLLMSSRSTVVDYKTKIQVLEEQLDDQKKTVRKLKVDIEQLMNQASEKQDEIYQKESRVQKLSSELKLVENTKKAELENIEHRFQELESAFEAKDQAYKTLHDHSQALEETLFKLNRDKERESRKKDEENELTKKSLHDDMQRQIKISEKKHKEEKESFQSNINDLQSRNKELQDDYDACRRNLRCVTDDFEDYQMNSEETIRSYQKEIAVLEATKTNDNIYIQKKCAEQEQLIAALRKENEEMKTNHKNDFDRFKREILKSQREEMQREKEAYQKKHEALMEKLKTVEAEKEMNEKRVRNIVKRDDSEELQKVRQELDEAKTRLSKLMGQKLKDNNPNITDLSDQNRPTKLAERYTELYDNQWTDAFEVLDDGHECQTIQRLMTILYDAMKYCRKESEKQMKTLMNIVVMTASQGDTGVSSAVQKQLKDCRKASAEKAVKHLYQSYQSQLSDDANRVPDYAKECFELCWFMSIQDPPVVLGSEPQSGSRFQTELYRAYTKSGSTVDYLVWPTLFLHDGGSILSKGVAQGR